MIAFVGFIVWIYWFFTKPMSPDEQRRRKLIAQVHVPHGMGD
jgi:hypothetical protein